MAAVYAYTSGSSPRSCSTCRSSTASLYFLARAQALMALVYVIISGSTPGSRWHCCSKLIESFHRPALAHADSNALKVTTSGLMFRVRIFWRRAIAWPTSLALAQAEMMMLYIRVDCGISHFSISSRSWRARRHCDRFRSPRTTRSKVCEVGSAPLSRIDMRSVTACSDSADEAQASSA